MAVQPWAGAGDVWRVLGWNHVVIPGHCAAMSPESRTDVVAAKGAVGLSIIMMKGIGSGFRAQACGLPRNDGWGSSGFISPTGHTACAASLP